MTTPGRPSQAHLGVDASERTGTHAYGIELLDLPRAMPSAKGPTRGSLHWRVDSSRAFAPSPRWWVRETRDGAIVHFHDEAEFRLRPDPQGEVAVTLGPVTNAEAVISFVLAALPLALPLFDLEPFHGAGLEAQGQALLVLGHPEVGKSTTAAALRERGLRFLADDACAIDESGELWPGAPLLAVRGGESAEPFARYDGKTVLAIADHDTTPRSVGASIVLRPSSGSSLGVDTLGSRDAMSVLLGEVRSPRVMAARRARLQLDCAARLAQERVCVATFDKAMHPPGHVADAIIRGLGLG